MVKVHRLTIDKVRGDQDWSALETDLLADCALGRGAYLPVRHDLPADQGDPDRRIRPALIRYLLLGGCGSDGGHRPHANGVQVAGGWIDGVLDLSGVRSDLDLAMVNCQFNDAAVLRDASLGALNLSGSHAKAGVDLHRLQTSGAVHLSRGFRCDGLINLGSAEITGQLACDGGQFVNPGKTALDADAARIGADVFLSDGFRAEGEVDLCGAGITGQLACTGGQFVNPGKTALNANAARIGADVFLRGGFRAEGAVDFVRANVTGGLQVVGARLDGGFDGEAMTVGAPFLWLEVTGKRAFVNLTEVQVGSLRDDRASWNGVGTIRLSGFRYDRVESAMTVGERLKWLARKAEWPMPFPAGYSPVAQPWVREIQTFDPQPYSHYAKVLQGQGARAAAARVLLERERRLSRAAYLRSLARLDGGVAMGFRSLGSLLRRSWDHAFGLMFGYGHQPARIFLTLIPLWVLTALLYGHIYALGQMAPNSAVILTSADWLAAVAQGAHDRVPALHIWTGAAGYLPKPSYEDYETFSAALYAADLFIPLDAIGQEGAWAPSFDRGVWGEVGYWARFPIQLAGWVITAVGAAVVTGLVGKKE
jgi:hypothetical protein